MQHRGIQGWIHRMPNGRRLSLQAQSAILLAAALVVTTVAGSLVSIAMMREEQAIARDALAAALLEKDFASLERDVYRHTTLGTAETRADMEQNIAELMGAVRTAKATFGSDQVAEFQRIEAAAADYVAKVAAATSGPRSPSLVAAMAEAGGAADDAIEAVRDPIIAKEQKTAALQEQLALAVAIASLLIALLSGAISWLLARSVRRAVNGDIESLRHSVSAIAAGRLDEAVPLADRSDEIGDLARASETLRQNSIAKREGDEETAAMVAIVGESLEKLAAGDLTVSVPSLGSRYDLLHTNLNVMIARLREAIGLVAEAADRITGSAGEISQASTDLAQRTEVHSAELAQASNAIGQITTSIHASAESAESANAAVTIAVTEAGEGAAIARQAVEAMANIERTTGEIGNIIAMIDSIAFQTNLLALNAGVEAARAGDLGNGFAVVANEVRALAQRSADAATDIKSLITGSAEHVSAGAGLVRQAGGALERIGQRIDEVTGMVRGITEASSEQATRLSATNDSVSSMDRVTQHSAAMAEESTAVAQSLAAEATRLSELVARFRLTTDAPAVPVRPARATVVPAQPAVSVRPLPSPPRRAAAGGAAVAAVAEDWTEF